MGDVRRINPDDGKPPRAGFILSCRYQGSSKTYDYRSRSAVERGEWVEVRGRHGGRARVQVVECRPGANHDDRFELKWIEGDGAVDN